MRGVTLALVIAASVFAVDQGSKYWVLEGLGLRERLQIDAGPFLDLVLSRNTGVNFGLFSSASASHQFLLAALAAAVSAALLVWSAYARDRGIEAACGLIVGGALGNAYDRLREGAVIDFLNVECCGIENPFAFNVADTAIFFGAVAIAWLAWRDDPPARDAKTAAPGGDKGDPR